MNQSCRIKRGRVASLNRFSGKRRTKFPKKLRRMEKRVLPKNEGDCEKSEVSRLPRSSGRLPWLHSGLTLTQPPQEQKKWNERKHEKEGPAAAVN